jgi:adenylate kinase family enzyme
MRCLTPYRKIHILGGPGSGKSFIAARIAATYGLPVFDLDEIFWDPRADHYGIRAPAAERDQALSRILDAEAWIIEGVYYRWVSPSFERADKIILLTPSVWVRHWRILKRFLKRRVGLIPAKKKESLSGLRQLMRWNHRYNAEMLQPARLSIEHLSHKVVECKTMREVLLALRP